MPDHAAKMIDLAYKPWRGGSLPTLMAPTLWARCAQQPNAFNLGVIAECIVRHGQSLATANCLRMDSAFFSPDVHR